MRKPTTDEVERLGVLLPDLIATAATANDFVHSYLEVDPRVSPDAHELAQLGTCFHSEPDLVELFDLTARARLALADVLEALEAIPPLNAPPARRRLLARVRRARQ
jgi:hypothetical protein